jgi:O-succinylbenzoic acid--CoA ligase
VSASLEQRLIRAAGQAKMKLYHGFGMTETLTHIATRALGDPAYCTLPGIGIATNEAGALVVHAPERGVHHLVTRDAIELRPMTNGADAQAFTWLGRLDDVINSGGLNLHPSAIEAELGPRISALIQGRRWYVAGRTDSRLGHRVALVLEGAEDTALEEAVMNAVRDMGLSRPRSVEFMALFEETNTGKVRRK